MTTQIRPTNHISFIEAVLLRPQMYTLSGTFGEVISFLEGYYSGMAKSDPYAPPVQEWAAFEQWLFHDMSARPNTFAAFQERYGENDAIKALQECYLQFRSGGGK